MIKVENITTYGWEEAIRGMRNPLNSWARMDSAQVENGEFNIGENDIGLMKRLFKAGTEHRKYLRMITVYMDITAPLFWWKEADTYKVGTVANSCSTMHKIQAKEFELADFSVEHLKEDSLKNMESTIEILNKYRNEYNTNKDKDDWWQMIQLLPTAYNQKRTVMMNYEVVMSMIRQRTNHKLDEWNEFVKILHELPYVDELLETIE